MLRLTGLFIVLCFTGLYSSLSKALSCGDLVTTNVTLSSDLVCTTGYTVLDVAANGITIDLNGFMISGTPSMSGITVVGYNNVSIRNGAITGVFAGVNTAHTDNLHVDSMVFYDVGSGVTLSSSSNGLVEKNDFINTRAQGVFIANFVAGHTATHNRVLDNEFFQTRIGVEICGDASDHNIVSSNLMWKTTDYGVYITHSNNNTIENNRILETVDTAVLLRNASYNLLQSNSLRVGRIGYAIMADTTSACLSSGSASSHKNRFEGNHSIGFDVGASLGLGITSSAMVQKNAVRYNKLYDNTIGLRFDTDAHRNNGRGNAYSGTTTPVDDFGVGNVY